MPLIYDLIPKVMNEIGAIGKNQENKQQGFKFRGIDQVYNKLQPILAKYGLFSIPEVLETIHEERTTKSGGALIYRIYKIKYTMYAPDGSNVSGIVVGEGMDSGDKAGNKALAIGHKYFYFQLFSIPTEEMVDPDSESHEVKPRETKPRMKPGQKDFISVVYELLPVIGQTEFNRVLGVHGFTKAEEVTDREIQLAIYGDMKAVKDNISKTDDIPY